MEENKKSGKAADTVRTSEGKLTQDCLPEFKEFLSGCLSALRGYRKMALKSVPKDDARWEEFKDELPIIDACQKNLDSVKNVGTLASLMDSLPQEYFKGFIMFAFGLEQRLIDDYLKKLDDACSQGAEDDGPAATKA